jgi:type IV secretion system protein VirB10
MSGKDGWENPGYDPDDGAYGAEPPEGGSMDGGPDETSNPESPDYSPDDGGGPENPDGGPGAEETASPPEEETPPYFPGFDGGFSPEDSGGGMYGAEPPEGEPMDGGGGDDGPGGESPDFPPDNEGGFSPGDSDDAPAEDQFFQDFQADAGAPGGEGGEEAASGKPELSTREDGEETRQPYSGEKKPPDSVIKSKPAVLNRQLILYIAGGIAIAGLIFAAFILPALQANSKKTEQKKKQAPAAVTPGDYYSLVPRSDARNLDNPGAPPDPDYTKFWEEENDDDIINGLPPIDSRYQNNNPQAQPAAPSGGGGGGGRVRPDTRGDQLQSKNIPGIKGLTPSRQQYLDGPGRMPPAQAPDPDNPYAQFGMPPKDEYMNQMLAAQQQYGGGSSGYAAQNDQGGKMNFYNQGRENAGNGWWLSPSSIWQGTIFEAALTSRINTDLPGECTALITKNVYSTQDGKYLLIPQNSRLLGAYNSSISYSQKRVQVAWHTLIRPDGYYINLGNMQAADPRGASGLPGVINDHPFQYFKAVLLLSAMNIVNSELSYSMAGTNNQYVQNVMANTQEMANALGGKIIDRALDVQPTITIKEGTRINIVANNNLVLPPMQPYPVTYPYRRGAGR